jgi:hypothetical protein
MNNDNFGLKDVIKYYKKQGYIFYNLSKLKTFKDYLDFEIYKRKNKDNLIIYVNCFSYFCKKTTKFYKKIIKLFYIYFNIRCLRLIKNYNFTKNTIIFLYKNKFFFTNKNGIKNKNKISYIQDILLTKYYKCDVCFNEECERINKCFYCTFQKCDSCNKKLMKMSNICCCCKNKCKYNY